LRGKTTRSSSHITCDFPIAEALTKDVTNLGTDVNGVATDLDPTKNNLQMARGEFGTLIARNHDEVEELRRLGERDYYEFNIEKLDLREKVGDVMVELQATNSKTSQYSVTIFVDDQRYDKKDITANEPLYLFENGEHAPLEFVVTQVGQDKVMGYLSVPKANTKFTDSGAYFVAVSMHPSAEMPQKVTQTFSVDDAGDCTIKQIRSSTVCLNDGIAEKLGDFHINASACGSKPLGGSVHGSCATVDYLLQGDCSQKDSGRARVAFEFPVEGTSFKRQYLEMYTSPRARISDSEKASPFFQYPFAIPQEAKNVKWEYSVDLLRVSNETVVDEIRVDDTNPEAGGVKSTMSSDGRLLLSISEAVGKWSNEKK
jgi:hypothetical protein